MPNIFTHADLHRLRTPELLALQRKLSLALTDCEEHSERKRQIKASHDLISRTLAARPSPRPPGL